MIRVLVFAICLLVQPALAQVPIIGAPSLESQLPEAAKVPENPKNLDIFQEAEGAPACEKLALHLYHCRQYGCTTKEGIEHAIRGQTPDGLACRHLQTLPGGQQVIDCQYSAPMQALIAKIQIKGENFLTPREKALMSEAFERECEIKDLGSI